MKFRQIALNPLMFKSNQYLNQIKPLSIQKLFSGQHWRCFKLLRIFGVNVCSWDANNKIATTQDASDTDAEKEVDLRPLDATRKRPCGRRGDELWRVAAAEACGAALLVLLTCLPAAGGAGATLLQRALASGLVVALIVQCFDHVSGAHLNPAMTLAAALTRRVSWSRAAAECVSQLAGATLGAAALHLLASHDVLNACVTRPAADISVYQAVAIETLLSICLALANLAAWDVRNQYLLDSWPLRIGLVVVALSLVAGDLTGASMNPVRSFAPALLSGDWTSHWVYWVGPLGGACAGSALHAAAWRAPSDATRRGSHTHACTQTHSDTNTYAQNKILP